MTLKWKFVYYCIMIDLILRSALFRGLLLKVGIMMQNGSSSYLSMLYFLTKYSLSSSARLDGLVGSWPTMNLHFLTRARSSFVR